MSEFDKSIAHEAHKLVHGHRAKDYGHPRFDFSAIAKVWTGLLQDLLKEDAHIDPYRIAVLMSGLKLCRLVKSPGHHDSRVDTIGYMLTMERLDEPEESVIQRAEHSMQEDLDDEENESLPTAQDLFPIKFSEVRVWFEAGESKYINGDVYTNTQASGTTIVFPFTPGTSVEIKPVPSGFPEFGTSEFDKRVEKVAAEQAKTGWVEPKCPAHGKEKCPACSQNPDPSKCQCGYIESTGMHWDTCPGRIRGILPTTAEEVAKLHPGKIHEVHGGDKDCWCGFKAKKTIPAFGTPEFDKLAEQVAAEQAKSWPKPEPEHSHLQQEPCVPGCPVFDAAKARNIDQINSTFGFTGEQVDIQRPPSTPWERND